jgi:putative protease
LLSPAGDAQCLQAAIENGADAVYFGLQSGFNARDRARSFAVDDLADVMQLLHSRGLRGYVTLNTLVFPAELPELERLALHIARCGVDAVLVQDLGAVQLLRAICPALEIHASTQMTLTSAESIRVAEAMGIRRVVLARELAVAEIRKIAQQTTIPLEVFVHGALCVAYSGQCLTSESLGGRSANRGQCAQACRLPYELVCDGQDVDLGAMKYLLSPQDLAAYALLPELLDAGVTSFKIEGRLKTPEYVANITHHYRRALDAALEQRAAAFGPQDIEEMELSFSRGFSPGWLQGCDHKRLVPGFTSAKRGVLLGEVVGLSGRRVTVRLQRGVKPGDGIVFAGDRDQGQEQGGRVYAIYRRNQRVTGTVAEGLVQLTFGREDVDLKQLQVGQQIWKTDDPELTRRLRRTFQTADPQRQISLTIEVRATVGQPLHVTCQAMTGWTCTLSSQEPLQAAVKHPLSVAVLQQQFGRLGGTPYRLAAVQARLEGEPMVPLSVLGRLRHELVEALNAAALARPPRDIAPDALARLRAEAERGSVVFAPAERPISADAMSGGVPADQSASRTLPNDDASSPSLSVLCRSIAQLQAALVADVREVLADFQDIRLYGQAVQASRAAGARIYLATPRVQKPGEQGIFRALSRRGADGILVRNLGGLAYFGAAGVPMLADYSLNAANDLTVHYLRRQGVQRVTASFDLNREQLLDLVAAVPRDWVDVVVHQHMPLFHMEHCVFCAVLSPGTNKTNCGRPCDRHLVQLRDRVGMQHPLTADIGCRNTLFNAQAQSAAEVVPALQRAGVCYFRIDLLDETPEEVQQVVRLYRDLLAGRVAGKDVWRQLSAANRVGVTRGTLEERRNPLAIL